MQKTFLPTKNPLKSKVNWLFVLLGLTELPQVRETLGTITPLATPLLAIAGIIARTFYTSTILKIKS
jgi:hypothetical protein